MVLRWGCSQKVREGIFIGANFLPTCSLIYIGDHVKGLCVSGAGNYLDIKDYLRWKTECLGLKPFLKWHSKGIFLL